MRISWRGPVRLRTLACYGETTFAWLANRSSLTNTGERRLGLPPVALCEPFGQPTFAMRATVGTLRASHERRVAGCLGRFSQLSHQRCVADSGRFLLDRPHDSMPRGPT